MSSGQSSQASTAPAAIPTGPSLEVLIGDVAYQLPSSDKDPIGVLLMVLLRSSSQAISLLEVKP
jgi:hypothetical protein